MDPGGSRAGRVAARGERGQQEQQEQEQEQEQQQQQEEEEELFRGAEPPRGRASTAKHKPFGTPHSDYRRIVLGLRPYLLNGFRRALLLVSLKSHSALVILE